MSWFTAADWFGFSRFFERYTLAAQGYCGLIARDGANLQREQRAFIMPSARMSTKMRPLPIAAKIYYLFAPICYRWQDSINIAGALISQQLFSFSEADFYGFIKNARLRYTMLSLHFYWKYKYLSAPQLHMPMRFATLPSCDDLLIKMNNKESKMMLLRYVLLMLCFIYFSHAIY